MSFKYYKEQNEAVGIFKSKEADYESRFNERHYDKYMTGCLVV